MLPFPHLWDTIALWFGLDMGKEIRYNFFTFEKYVTYLNTEFVWTDEQPGYTEAY